MLARANWARWQVQLMARHTSSTIDTYVNLAWADATVQWAKGSASGGRGPKAAGPTAMKLSIDELKTLMEERSGTQINREALEDLRGGGPRRSEGHDIEVEGRCSPSGGPGCMHQGAGP